MNLKRGGESNAIWALLPSQVKMAFKVPGGLEIR
jgi:hypothetical protein